MSMRTPARLLLGLAALIMLAGGAFHGLAYPKAMAAIGASHLSPRRVAIFKGLWLNDAAVVMLLGVIYLAVASRPAPSATSFRAICCWPPRPWCPSQHWFRIPASHRLPRGSAQDNACGRPPSLQVSVAREQGSLSRSHSYPFRAHS